MTVTTLEKDLADALLGAVREVFETMVMMPPKEITTVEAGPACLHGEVIGVLGFSGTKAGALALSTSAELAKRICASMLGMTPEEIGSNQEVADSFGEVANMITGNFKNAWIARGNKMDLAIPSVTFGQETTFAPLKEGATAFACQVGFADGALQLDLRLMG